MELFTDVDYSEALIEQYGAGNSPYSDRYVFNSQEGNGFGSALSSLGSWALPLIKKVLPFLKSAGKEAIKGGLEYALNKTTEKVTRKRKARPKKSVTVRHSSRKRQKL